MLLYSFQSKFAPLVFFQPVAVNTFMYNIITNYDTYSFKIKDQISKKILFTALLDSFRLQPGLLYITAVPGGR